MKYTKTKYPGKFAGSDGEIYSDYKVGKMTQSKSKLKSNSKVTNTTVNGSKAYINVKREIATAYVPNPEGLRLVITKDKDPMNTHPDNLMWSNVSNMDYKSFAKKKLGTKYKSFVGEIVGDYKVITDLADKCTIECTSCQDTITVNRLSVRNKKVCEYCIDRSLDLSSLDSAAFSNWSIIKEDKTEDQIEVNKRLIIQCKCCNQEDIIRYAYFKSCKTEYKCSVLKKKRRLLQVRFSNMKQRCQNIKSKDYKNYGGRGINICKEWLGNSENFVQWSLNNGYELGLEIDRKDNNKDYSPENCRYTTKTENSRNQRTNVITHDIARKIKNTNWRDMTNKEIAKQLGVESSSAIGYVLKGETWKGV